MTADEIRGLWIVDKSHPHSILAEIAAQLAELNAKLYDITSPESQYMG
jgi:hypothetical protein